MGQILSNVMRMWGNTKARILLIGLDAAGKTAVIYKLQLGENVQTVPTIGFNVETVSYKKLDFTIFDVGGQDRIRALWHHYYAGTNGIIFVVDSADTERLQEARDELHKTLKSDLLQNVPLLVLANKQDLERSRTPAQITQALGLSSIRDRKWHVQGSCAVSGDGLVEGMDFLSAAVRNSPEH
eukprot:TRINITY_DN5913_c0_g1_i1.p1 TRINITY_DN5913_c0_g1~~TRINITY_DN5913_c0_g1_i1.p1  ORF type:complete len:183 (-),score=39.27 TRINITY_DN5913_c0_g1_i1:50-598(-)